MLSIRSLLLLLLLLPHTLLLHAFVVSRTSSLTQSSFHGRNFVQWKGPRPSVSSAKLRMFLQDTGGILGIGAPEIATIAIVGYFVLGPEDLYKLTKEIGKFITNLRSVAAETTATFENTMESQLQMKEMQNAARELNDAFSFRRSINYDEDFTTVDKDASTVDDDVSSSNVSEKLNTETEVASATSTRKKRRKKKKITPPPPSQSEEFPEDLEMPIASTGNEWYNSDLAMPDDLPTTSDEISSRESRIARLQQSAPNSEVNEFELPQFSDAAEKAAADAAIAKYDLQREQKSLDATAENGLDMSKYDAAEEADAQARFAAQLSQNWNQSIMDNSEKLEPLAKVMERLAILEEERAAAEKRLEEEFRLRTDLEERFYKEKRQLLEEAAAEIQADAYENVDLNTNSSSAKNNRI